MSDWQFASKQGNLKWTSPVIPDKGTMLFSALSPTLLLGYRVKGELFPVEYVKLADICRVSRSGEKGVELEKGGDDTPDGGKQPGSTILVVAESPSSADDWFSMINIAMQDNDAAAGVKGGPVMGSSSRNHSQQERSTGMSTAQQDHQPLGSLALQDPPQQQPLHPVSDVPRPQPNPNPATAPSPAPQHPQQNQEQEQEQTKQQQQSQYSQGLQDSIDNHHNRSAPSSVGRPYEDRQITFPPQQQQQPTGLLGGGSVSDQECQNDPSGHHEFRPLSEFTRNHQNQQQPLPLGSSSSSLTAGGPRGGGVMATTTSNVVQEQVRTTHTIQQPTKSMLRPLPSQSPIQSSAVGQDSTLWGPGGSRLGSNGPPRGISQPSIPTTPGGQQLRQLQQATPGSGIRPRSGMMVSMPATQTVNRNIAPNMSAMWKEWDAPDGCTYLMYEPKGTMLRRKEGETEFEPYVQGAEELTDEEYASNPYASGVGAETTANLNNQSVRNLQTYGHNAADVAAPSNSQFGGNRSIQSPSVYRTEVVASPRGQYSPSRRAPVTAMASPREAQAGYVGRRVHRVQLGVSHDKPGASVIQHEVETLGSQGLTWNQNTNEVGFNNSGNQDRSLGGGKPNPTAAVHKQWHEIRTILMRGRYFKKHALKSNTSQNRMVFLTSDNSYVCAVPTSSVMQNASRDPGSLNNVAECVQYYGADTRAMALNEILYVTMGTEEDFVYNKKGVNPESTFCIISKKHAFVLECRNAEEAQFFCDSWTFFLFHSKPLNPGKKRTPQMIAPVTHGTRSGIQF